jgi:hypothetical protein
MQMFCVVDISSGRNGMTTNASRLYSSWAYPNLAIHHIAECKHDAVADALSSINHHALYAVAIIEPFSGWAIRI